MSPVGQERGGNEQLGGDAPRLPEEAIYASVPRREHLEGELCEDDGDREPDRAEDRPAHLEDEHEGDGHENARLVRGDARRIDTGEPGHEREPRMPHRERVAGMQPGMPELPDVVQRERMERLELPDAAEVEEDVAGEGALHEPDADAEPDTRQAHGATRETGLAGQPYPLQPSAQQRPDEGDRARGEHEGERHVQRGAQRKRQRKAGSHERDRRGERGRGAPLPQAPRDEHSREQDDERRRREPHPEPEPRLWQEPRDPEQGHDCSGGDETPDGIRRRRHHRRPPQLQGRLREPVQGAAPASGTGRARRLSRATMTAPGKAAATVTRKKRNPAEKA